MKEIAIAEFKHVTSLNGSILKQPKVLFNSLLLQRCIKMKWNMNECELCYEIKDDDDTTASELKSKDAILLSGLKIIGAKWNPQKKSLEKSE